LKDLQQSEENKINNEFENYKLDKEILKAIEALGYKRPSKVQEKAIPVILQGKDAIVKSQTGSGKTAAFGIPICSMVELEERSPQALVLAPTRELAVQIKEDLTNIGRFRRIRCTAVYGKHPMEIQARELKQRVHIVAGTPGRTLDHLERGNIKTDKIKYVIIDEADEMLSLGFIDQVRAIIEKMPKERITLLFSATVPEVIEELCKSYMVDPVMLEVNPEKLTVEKIEQRLYKVEEDNKFEVLKRILYIENPESCIFFCKTKENVDKLLRLMKALDYPCEELHGGMEQAQRLDIMKSFKRGAFKFLVTTDVAARGIDIDNVSLVVNYDVPVEKERYVHRIGRTGRAGKKGVAVTLFTERENRLIENIKEYISMELVEAEIPSREEAKKFEEDFLESNRKKPKIKEDKGAALNKGIYKIYIGAGKDKKLRPGDVVGAVTSIEGINAEDIGIIDIQDRHSYVEILNNKGKKVLEILKTTKIKGKYFKVDRSSRV
jgi:superfamily II DNA/RNA helicase